MTQEELTGRYSGLPGDMQLRVLASFGHSMTIAARETYEFQAPEIHEPLRLRAINEIQHRVFGQMMCLQVSDARRYPDDVLLSIFFEYGDDHLRRRTLGAMAEALERFAD